MENSILKMQVSNKRTKNIALCIAMSVLMFAIVLCGALVFQNSIKPSVFAETSNFVTSLDQIPEFTFGKDESKGYYTVTGTNQTINGYNFANDVYYVDATEDGNISYFVGYATEDKLEVVVPSKIMVSGTTYDVLLDTSWLGSFFQNCANVQKISFASVDGEPVKASFLAERLFNGCVNLQELDITNLDMSRPLFFNKMFYDCKSLQSVTLNSTFGKKLADISEMFYNCQSLQTVDISALKLNQSANFDNFFYNCSNLQSIVLPQGFSEVWDISLPYMFCLQSDNSVLGDSLNAFGLHASTPSNKITIQKADTSNKFLKILVGTGAGTVSDGTKDAGILTYALPANTSIQINGTSILFDDKTITSNPGTSYGAGITFENYTSNGSVLSETFNLTADTTIYANFSASSSLMYPEFRVSTTSNGKIVGITGVTDNYVLSNGSNYNFTQDVYECTVNNDFVLPSQQVSNQIFLSSYTSRNIENIAIPSNIVIDGKIYQVVINAEAQLFSTPSSIKTIVFESIDGAKVLATNCQALFSGCSNITKLDLSNLDVSYIQRMGFMFGGCSSLTEINFGNFNSGLAWTTDEMFTGCRSLVDLDMRNVDISNVFLATNMFSDCTSLKTLKQNFDTSNIKNMGMMFSNCSSLTSLDLSNFDTSNVIDMMFMFAGCSSLKSLNLSSFTFDSISSANNVLGMLGINKQYTYLALLANGLSEAEASATADMVYQSEDINDRISAFALVLEQMGMSSAEEYSAMLFNTKIERIVAPKAEISANIIIGLPGEDAFYDTSSAESEGQYFLTSGPALVLSTQRAVPSTGVSANIAMSILLIILPISLLMFSKSKKKIKAK